MLKKTLTYMNFNGLETTEDFYFNLSEAELLQLETSEKGGYGEMLKNISAAENGHTILTTFKKIILLAYGEKSDDGRFFVKSDEVRTSFENHAAFPVLYMELASNAESAQEFANGIMPANMTAGELMAGKRPATQDHQQKKVVEKDLPTVSPEEQADLAAFRAWQEQQRVTGALPETPAQAWTPDEQAAANPQVGQTVAPEFPHQS